MTALELGKKPLLCGMSNPSSDAPELVELEAPPDNLILNER